MTSSLPSAANPPPTDGHFPQITTGDTRRKQEEEREMADILPLELWFEILVRLQVRPLLILKCVSKCFLSLIRNPNFKFLHFTRFNNEFSDSIPNPNPNPNPSRLQLLLLNKSNRGFNDKIFVTCPRNQFRMLTPDTDYDELFECGNFDCNVVGYVNGLLLMFKRHPTLCSKDTIILWNPSLRKSIPIPLPQAYCMWSHRPKLGFGYDSVSGDYKIVSFMGTQSQTSVQVYNLRTGSWRTIWYDSDYTFWHLKGQPGVFLNGAIHWIAVQRNAFRHRSLVSLDLGSELFSFTMLEEDEPCMNFLLVFDGLLGRFSYSFSSIRLWVMREGGWSKEYEADSVSSKAVRILGRFNEDRSPIFSYKNCELLVATPERLLSINTQTKKLEFYDIRAAAYVATITESLLWRELLPPLDLN